MNDKTFRALSLLVAGALAVESPALAQTKKAASKPAAVRPAAALTPPKIEIGVESLMDRRSTGDFPPPGLSLMLSLQGADAGAVMSVRPRVTKAADDTGRNLIPAEGRTMQSGTDGWQSALGGHGAPTPRLELASPARKAKTVVALEGVLETYLPSRDPAATVKIDRVLAKKDKPLTVPALAGQRIHLRVLSKAGLERDKKAAEAKKAQAAKKKGKEGLEGMAETMVESLVNALGMLFMTAGENDLILKVDDPGKKIFSFDIAGADGKPIPSYGSTDLEGYRIVRMLEPIPATAALQVRLKTPKSFGELPFALSNLKLP